MSDNLTRLLARHSENKKTFKPQGGGFQWLDLRNDLPDGETRMRVVPNPDLDPYHTFIFRGKHRGIIPPTELDLKKNPDAKYKAITCNLMFDDYCLVCDVVNKLAETEDQDLRDQASYHAAIPVVYFNAYLIGQEDTGIYVATTTRESVIETIRGWIKSEEYEEKQYMHPKTGKSIIIKKASKERKDGKIQVDLDLSVGQKTIPLTEEQLKKHQDLGKILKQVSDDKVSAYLESMYSEFVA